MVEVERAGHSKGDPRRLWHIVQGRTAAALGRLLFFSKVQWGSRGFPGGSDERICLQYRRPGFDPWVRKIRWRRKWQPTLAFLPGKSYGQRSLVSYSPWGHKSQT